jgi:hypothetical protein
MKKSMLSLHLILLLAVGVTNIFGGYSLSFDGVDDYAEIVNCDELAGLAEITVSAWIKPANLTSTGVIAAKWANPEGPDRAYTFRVDQSGIVAVNIRTANGGDYAATFSTSEMAVNEWAYLSFSYSTPDLKLFLNGIERASTTTSGGNIIPSSTSLLFGNSDGLTQSYEGLMDEVSIWDVSLTETQIQAFMNLSLQGDESNLIGHWNLNEGVGMTFSDLNINGNNGSVYGAIWSTDVPPTPSEQIDFSLEFGQGDYMQIPMSESLSTFNTFTVELWYHETNGANETIFGSENSNPTGGRIQIMRYGGNFDIAVFDGSLTIANSSVAGVSSGTWQHLALSYDGDHVRFFIDGSVAWQAQASLGEISLADDVFVVNRHSWNGGASSNLIGLIDEIRISENARYTSAFTPSTQVFAPDAHTVGLWHFNNDLQDMSGNQNHGVANGTGFSDNTPGLVPLEEETSNTHSLEFDDIDRINLDSPFTTSELQNITIETWVWADSSSDLIYYGSDCGKNIFSQGSDPSHWADFGFGLADNGGIPCLQVEFGHYEQYFLTTNSNQFPLAVWNHVTVTYSARVVQLFINGQFVSSQDIGVDPVNSDRIATIGSRVPRDDVHQGWAGLIDEFRVWSRVLDQSEIQSNMYTELTGSESDLLGYWNFNGGTGTQLIDQTTNGNNGTILGATWSTDVPFTGSVTTSNLTWSLQIQGSQSSLNDVDNYLGVAPDASNGFDAAHDEAEPPASPGSSLSLYFPHTEWNHTLGDDFSSDIRPEIDLSDTMQVWDFEVVSTDDGNVSLNFQYMDIPDVPVILENEDTGERVFLVHNDSYDFTAVANMTYFFKVSIGDTTAPQVHAGRSFSGPRILRAGHPHDLDFFALDGFMVDQMDLLFSSDSGNYFEPFATFGDTTDHEWLTPDDFDNVLYGAAVQIKAIDYAGNSATAESDYVLTIASDSLFADVYSGWTLWGAPIEPTVDTMATNIGDDFTGYWTTYDYVDNGYTYDGFLYQGEGYWLGTLEDTEVDVVGMASGWAEEVSLSLGWDLLSNPLVTDVYLDSLIIINNSSADTMRYPQAVAAGWVNSIYAFDGNGYVEPDVLKPWQGYWFGVLAENLVAKFPIHRHDQTVLARDDREDGWLIQLFAETSNGAEDNLLMLGAHPEASDDFDNGFDEVRPPQAPGTRFVQLDILHPEWDFPLGDAFIRDIRSENLDDANEDWIVNVDGSEAEITLTWDLLDVPESFDVGIDLDGDGIFEDLSSFESLIIPAGSQFVLRAGVNALSVDQLSIPTEFLLNQNYPNPFNPSTTITYGLPEISDIKVTIYDITGREVIQLVNSSQMVAGYHDIIWSGMDSGSHSVSTGLYFTRIEAGDYTKTIKMLFLK